MNHCSRIKHTKNVRAKSVVTGGAIFMITTRLKETNSAEIQKNGLEALRQALGITGTIKLLEQFDHGRSGDYTREKYENAEQEPTDEEIRCMFGF